MRRLLAAFAMACLAGCAAVPPAPAPEPIASVVPEPEPEPPVRGSTLLLPVGFVNLLRPGHVPAVMELALRHEGGTELAFVQAATLPLGTDSPGAADYLFRFVLPPGRYEVLRIAGSTRPRQGTAAQIDARVRIPLEVGEAPVRYLGRIVIQNAPATLRRGPAGLDGGELRFNTAWPVDDDLAQYRTALGGSAPEDVERASFASLAVEGASGEAGEAAAFATLDVGRVSTTLAPPPLDASALPAGADARLRGAFERYRAARAPKAFAVSAAGQWGSAADSPDAATRALLDCARKGGRCRLFALDDTLVPGAPRP